MQRSSCDLLDRHFSKQVRVVNERVKDPEIARYSQPPHGCFCAQSAYEGASGSLSPHTGVREVNRAM